MTMNTDIEARYQEGQLDEVVADGVCLHLEQMDVNCWWLGIYKPDGSRVCLTFSARGRIKCEVTEGQPDVMLVDGVDKRTKCADNVEDQQGSA
jgi:hypothetical protein